MPSARDPHERLRYAFQVACGVSRRELVPQVREVLGTSSDPVPSQSLGQALVQAQMALAVLAAKMETLEYDQAIAARNHVDGLCNPMPASAHSNVVHVDFREACRRLGTGMG